MISDSKVWNHQSVALKHLCEGRNVVVSTGTASGKSLIFQLYALHRLLTVPDSKVLVFYPLKALSSDQFVSWQKAIELAGLNSEEVARIDGGVSKDERESIIEQARVVLMTPDVCQAWFMRTINSLSNSRFLDRLTLLVLDEAHVYESIFGSNAAFLIRRLLAAKHHLSLKKNRLQVIAATATIAEPAQHLNRLTGLKFSVVDESHDGAPRHPRRILHIEGPDQGANGEQAIAGILEGICQLKTQHRFIAFVDSRQGVERIARQVVERITEKLGRERVKPYRSGYEASDRKDIEQALRNGSLQGVVSTSALELGIDIKNLEIGINLGVPQSRKSFRQRLGRVGRSSPGVFLVVAPRNAFKQFGEKLSDYYDGSVEPSYLYLGNRFVQFAHARCLRDEKDSSKVPSGVKWTEGFSDILKFAREGWPREFDYLAQIGGDSPHLNYPLRQLGEANIKIQEGSGRDIGNIALHQAIREAYPGANYLHSGRVYRVIRWQHGFNEIIIRVTRYRNPVPTRPILRKIVTVDLSQDGIVDGRIKKGKTGMLAEVQVQVNERVDGYKIGSTQYLYRDLRVDNANMTRKQRDFRTTGVVIQIEEDWFVGSPPVRREIANGIRDLLCRDRSIAPQDVDAAYTNIAVRTVSGTNHITNAVIVYDIAYGGLRLTENLFSEFDRYVNQLERAADLAGDEAIIRDEIAKHLRAWAQTLTDGDVPPINVVVPEGWLQVFKPGSIVGIFRAGNIVERELIEPVYKDFFNTGSPQLFYAYRNDRNENGVSYTPHDATQPVGDQWEWILWNPETEKYKELEDTA